TFGVHLGASVKRFPGLPQLSKHFKMVETSHENGGGMTLQAAISALRSLQAKVDTMELTRA
ncbi:hypothetical protein A2U01_0067442, partial [Trifolium medium]|nr:hypothetical protein [Trifolium medium]